MAWGRVIVVILLIIGVGVGIYFGYKSLRPQPNQGEEVIKHNLFIRAMDNHSNEFITADFAVFDASTNGVVSNGTTIEGGRLRVQLTSNSSYLLYAWKEGNESFYTSLWRDEPFLVLEDREATVGLKRIGNLTASASGPLGTSPLEITLNRTGFISPIMICLRWSSNVIYVDLQNATLVQDVPERHKGRTDKCYEPRALENSTTIFTFDVRTRAELNERDYLRVIAIDTDLSRNLTGGGGLGGAGGQTFIFENETGSDIGARDVILEVRK